MKNKLRKENKNISKLDFTKTKPIAFKFMYVGKNYEGLVIQNHTNNTIEFNLFSALKKACLVESIEKSNYSRCGRTDAGVSATGNVFNLNIRYKEKEKVDYLKILNNILPKDIVIWSQAEVDKSFDSRFSCLYREYKYFFLKKNMNIELIKKAASKLQGTHNFKNFCKIDKSDPNYLTKNYERRIYEFKVEDYQKSTFPYNYIKNSENNIFDMCIVTIKGSAFLWHQVRCMMGILFLIGKGLEEVSIIDEMFIVDSGKTFNYEIASDLPLILTNCEFEGVDFKSNIENSSENYFKLADLHEQNIIQIYMSSFSFDYLTNILKTSIEMNRTVFERLNEERSLLSEKKSDYIENDDLIKNNEFCANARLMINFFESKHRRKRNYTKLLNHKTNREIEKKKKNN